MVVCCWGCAWGEAPPPLLRVVPLPGAGRIFLGGGGEGDQGSGLAGQADVVGVVLFFDAFCDVLQGGDVVELGVGWPDYFADAAALRVAHAG